MKRTNISLTEEQYERLKKQAYEDSKSMSEVVRGLIEADPLTEKKLDKFHKEAKKISETPKTIYETRRTTKVGEEGLNPAPKPKK